MVMEENTAATKEINHIERPIRIKEKHTPVRQQGYHVATRLNLVTLHFDLSKYTKECREAGKRLESGSQMQRCHMKTRRRGRLRAAYSQYASLLRRTISRRHRKRQERERRSARPKGREERRRRTRGMPPSASVSM